MVEAVSLELKNELTLPARPMRGMVVAARAVIHERT
jgi:hypothetical protein